MRSFSLLILFMLSTFPVFASLTREQVIARQMDCVSKTNSSDVSWNDVCYTPFDERSKTVDEELDEVEAWAEKSPSVREAKAILEEQMNKENNGLVESEARSVLEEQINNENQGITEREAKSALEEDIKTQNNGAAGLRAVLQNTDAAHISTEIEEEKKATLDPRHVHSLDVGVEPFLYQYEEPQVDVKIEGMMMGYYANYAYRPPDSNPLNNVILNTYMLEGRFASGRLDYSSGSGIDKGIPNYSFEIRGLLGNDYFLHDKALFTSYLGFGYRYLEYQGGGRLSDLGYYNYDRHSNYFYLPLGVTALVPAGAWSGRLNFEYDLFIQGEQVSDLSDGKQFTGFDNPDIHNRQTGGYGLRGSLRMAYAGKGLSFYVEPFIRYWDIERSQFASATVDGHSSDYWNEPHNRTIEIGSKVGFLF